MAESTKQKTAELLKKMSLGYMGCKGKEAIRQEKTVFMARIGGEIQDVKHKERRGGAGDVVSYFIGDFMATTAEGTLYESDTLFLPGFIFEKLEAQYKSGNEAPLTFGIDIFSQPNDKSSVGYAYVYKNVVDTEVSDRLKQVRQAFESKPLPNAPVEEKSETSKPDKKK